MYNKSSANKLGSLGSKQPETQGVQREDKTPAALSLLSPTGISVHTHTLPSSSGRPCCYRAPTRGCHELRPAEPSPQRWWVGGFASKQTQFLLNSIRILLCLARAGGGKTEPIHNLLVRPPVVYIICIKNYTKNRSNLLKYNEYTRAVASDHNTISSTMRSSTYIKSRGTLGRKHYKQNRRPVLVSALLNRART